MIQTTDLVALSQEFGNPLYVYDAEKIEFQYKRLTNAFAKVEKLRINYAMKALSNISVLKLLKNLGSGLDTVSLQEVQLGLHAGFTPDKIIFTPNGVSFEEIEAVVGKVHINTNESSNPKTPGALKSHYAPKKPLLFGDAIQLPTDKKIAVIAFDTYLADIPHTQQTLLSPSGDLNEAAKNLFAAMRELDNGDADIIFAIRFPNEGLGRAINDRLKRAGA